LAGGNAASGLPPTTAGLGFTGFFCPLLEPLVGTGAAFASRILAAIGIPLLRCRLFLPQIIFSAPLDNCC
jgi:hypothetical protein